MNLRVPAEVFPPGEFLKEELDARGWSQAELADILGRSPRVISEIISAKRAITPETAKGLAAALEGTNPQTWMNLETAYQLSKAKFEEAEVSRRARLYSKFPVKEMLRRRWVEPSASLEVLEQRFLDFFSIKSMNDTPVFSHMAKKTRYGGLSVLQIAWLNRAKQIARTIQVSKYSEAALRRALEEIRHCLQDINSIREVPSILAKAGVRIVIVEHLPGAKMDGACFWLDDDSPVVALSLRFDRVDNFWHTLLHELDHVLHGEGKDQPMIDVIEGDQVEKNQTMPKEDERANKAAANFCISSQELDKWISSKGRIFSRRNILAFASQRHVHPGIVVGQLQRRKAIPYSYHRNLLEKIRPIAVAVCATDGFGKNFGL